MIYRIINKDTGMFIRDDFTFDEYTEIALEVIPAEGFYKPRWNGEVWEEGATQSEIDALVNTKIEPTLEEVVDDLIKTLVDKGVLF